MSVATAIDVFVTILALVSCVLLLVSGILALAVALTTRTVNKVEKESANEREGLP